MSRVNNAYIPAAATALSLTVSEPVKPIADAMLNDVPVSAIGAAEVTDKGKCIVIATVTINGAQEVRPVADSNGNVKLYADGAAVVALAKRSNLAGGQSVQIVKKAVQGNIGDPIAALKSKHKQAATESVTAGKPLATLTQQITGAESLGWNTSPEGSPEKAEYDDLVKRKETVQEWKDATDARVTALAAALTAAGIDPVTYLPMP